MSVRWNEVEFGARLADMQEVDYRNTLAIASVIELLIEQGLLDADALRHKSAELDRAAGTAAKPFHLRLD